MQESVHQVLQKIIKGKTIQQEAWMLQIASSVDIMIGDKVIIQVRGPFRFYPEIKQYCSKNRLQTYLLNQLGYQVIRIPYYKWNSKSNIQEKINYLKEKLEIKVLNRIIGKGKLSCFLKYT